MPQPEVARHLLALAASLALAAPAVSGGWAMARAGSFVAEFLTGGATRPLSLMTLPPAVSSATSQAVSPATSQAARSGQAAPRCEDEDESRRGRVVRGPRESCRAVPGASGPLTTPAPRGIAIIPAGPGRGRPLVLVHGATPLGARDPRLLEAAGLLARLGNTVTVPHLPGLAAGRLEPEDIEPVVRAIVDAGTGVTVVGVSVGIGPALAGAADGRARPRVARVVSLGGHASGRELLGFFLTGDFAFEGERGRVAHDPAVVRAFVAANIDLLDAAERPAVLALDPVALRRLAATPPPRLAARLERLSPLTTAPHLTVPLIAVHGRHDTAVPYTESVRLARAWRAPVDLAVVGAIGHVEGRAGHTRAALGDLVTLWRVAYRLTAAD